MRDNKRKGVIMIDRFESSRRYKDIWEAATAEEHGVIIPTVEEEYVHGSLRPEVTSLCAEIGGQLIHLTNGEAAFLGEEESTTEKLSALEELLIS